MSEAKEPDPITLVCLRIQHSVLASHTGECSECHEIVGISTATRDYMLSLCGSVQYMCMECVAAKHLDKLREIMPMSTGQAQEIREYFQRREHERSGNA